MEPSETVSTHALLIARARTISRQRGTALAGSLMLMLFVIVALWQQHAATKLLAWFCANGLFVVWRMLRWRIAPFGPNMNEPEVRGWLRESACANGLNGLIWGIGALSFLTAENFGAFLFFVLVLTSLVFGAAVSFAAWFPSVVSFSVPVTLAAAAKMASLDLAGSSVIALSCGPFLLFVLTVAGNYSRLMTAFVALDVRNAALLEQSERSRAEIERVSQEKSRFFAAISHDLRQPLYAMVLLVEALGRRLTTDAQRELHEDIRRSQHAMDELFSSLLDLSQLDAGAINIKPEHVDLADLLATLGAEFSPGAAAKGIKIELPSAPPPLYSDAVLLSRILRNLIGNAVKFTDHGNVVITTASDGKRVTITVADTGLGIPPEQQELVFTEYFQLHNPERDRNNGLGLGLAVVRRLCELLEIPLTLESTPGEGTSVSISVAAGSSRTQSPSIIQAQSHDFGGLHVVVIDDEPSILLGMRALLEDCQCQVTTAPSVDLVMHELSNSRRPPDIVISDYRLPGDSNGIAAVSSLRESIDAELPALLITGDTDPEIGDRAMKAGLTLMHKPIEPARLLAVISELVDFQTE